MSPILAFTLLAPLQTPPAEASPYAYKLSVGQQAFYKVRFSFKTDEINSGVTQTVSTEVLSISPDGTAKIRMVISDQKGTGDSAEQTFEGAEETITIDRYGHFTDPDTMPREFKTLSPAFALPKIALAENVWTPVADPLDNGSKTIIIESTLGARKENRATFLFRTKAPAEDKPGRKPPSFTRETIFDGETGQLISVRLRGGDEGVKIEMDLDLQEAKR